MKLNKYILFTALYIGIMALGMTIMNYGLGIQYGSQEMAKVVIWIEIILTLLVVYYIRRYASWRDVGFGKITWTSVLWLAPTLLLSLISGAGAIMAIASGNPSSREIQSVVLVGLLTLLVGFSEETMFRGILLRGALARYNVIASLLISAVGFSLLHSVNIFGGEQTNEVGSQMFATLMDGLFMAPIAILVGNLIPLIIAHFLWDFILLAPTQVASTEVSSGFFALAQASIIPIQYVLMIVAWIVVFIRWKQGKFENPR